MSKEAPAGDENLVARERNDKVQTLTNSSLFVELRAELNALAELQRKPIQRVFVSLFGPRNRTQQRLTGLELKRLLDMAGVKARKDIDPDRMFWVQYRRFRNLMARAERRRSLWDESPPA